MNIIEDIKSYLKDWISTGKPPTNFKDINFDNKINIARQIVKLSYGDTTISSEIYNSFGDETIVYILGLYLYNSISNSKYSGDLTKREIREPRVYQFLNLVLKSQKSQRESSPDILLSILKFEPRDIIEEIVDSSEYRVELFSTLGLTRVKNQDYLGVLEIDNGICLIVADGVGGANGGEIASRLVIDYIIESIRDNISKYLSNKKYMQNFLKDTLFNANQELIKYSQDNSMGMMGTTLSLALIIDKINLFIAHIGDSRIYELEGSSIRQITQDHSVREVLFRSNKITKEQKREYKKGLLAFVLGKRNLKKENIFVQHSILYDNTQLLLCSDGFWEKIDIDIDIFKKSMDSLKDDIYNSIPTDNVTVIRYYPKNSKRSILVDNIYEEYKYDNPKKVKPQKLKRNSSNRTISRGQIVANRLNYLKNMLIFISIISSITFLILNFISTIKGE